MLTRFYQDGEVAEDAGSEAAFWSWPRESRGVGAVFGLDLVLLDAPSVYDWAGTTAL